MFQLSLKIWLFPYHCCCFPNVRNGFFKIPPLGFSDEKPCWVENLIAMILFIPTLFFVLIPSLRSLILLLLSASMYPILCSIKMEQFLLRILKVVSRFEKVTAPILSSVFYANCHPVAACQSTLYLSEIRLHTSARMPWDSWPCHWRCPNHWRSPCCCQSRH